MGRGDAAHFEPHTRRWAVEDTTCSSQTPYLMKSTRINRTGPKSLGRTFGGSKQIEQRAFTDR